MLQNKDQIAKLTFFPLKIRTTNNQTDNQGKLTRSQNHINKKDHKPQVPNFSTQTTNQTHHQSEQQPNTQKKQRKQYKTQINHHHSQIQQQWHSSPHQNKECGNGEKEELLVG